MSTQPHGQRLGLGRVAATFVVAATLPWLSSCAGSRDGTLDPGGRGVLPGELIRARGLAGRFVRRL